MSTDPPDRRTTITRPLDRPAASDRGRSRIGDVTRPIEVERRLTSSRRSTFLLAIGGLVVVAALSLALFGLPIRTYFGQDEQLTTRQEQLDRMRAINDDLRAEVERARTPAGIEEAARDQLGMVEPGEVRLSVLDDPAVPTELPAGWPYDLVTQIVSLRRVAAGLPPATSATTLPPPTTSAP